MFCCFRYNFMWTVGHQTTQLFHICCLCCSTSDNTNYSKHHSCQTVELQACTILWYELAHYMIKLVYLIEEIMIKALWVKKKWVPGHQVFYFFFSSLYYNLDQNKTAHWSVKLISKPTKIHIPHHSDISSWLLHFLHYEMHESWFVWKRKLSLEELYMLLGVSLDYYVPRISFLFWRFMYIHYVLDRLAKPFCSKSETF